MAEFNFYLKDSSTKKETPIYLYIRYKLEGKNCTFKFAIGEKITPENWNNEAKKGRKFEGSDEFNSRLAYYESRAKELFRKIVNDSNGKLPTIEELKTVFIADFRKQIYESPTKKEKLAFLPFYEKFIDERKTGINPKTGKKYSDTLVAEHRITLDKIQEFIQTRKLKAFDFEDITLDFYMDFTALLNKKNYSTNYIGKFIKNIKVVMNDAKERKLHSNLDYTLKRFSKTAETTPKIYLTVEELQLFQDFDLSENKRLERVRDLLLLGAWTGLRFSDFTTISRKDIYLHTPDQNDYIEKKTAKTGKTVIIPILEPVKRILERYDGLTANALPEPISNQRFNDYIKELGQLVGLDTPIHTAITKGGLEVSKMIPKYKALGSHVCRRSFATNAYQLGVPPLTIREITGHNTEAAFLKYIRATPKEHANKLRDIMTNAMNQKPKLKIA